MQDNNKTKAELTTEIEKLRKRVSLLEKRSVKQKKAMESLHEEFGLIERAVQGWRKTIDSSKTIMLLIGRDFRVKRVNLAASKFLGMSFHELLGRNCSELFLDIELSVEDCLIEKVVRTRKHEEAEFFLPGKNIWFLATVDPVLDDKGELSEIVQVIYDITDRKRAEEELKEAIRRIEEEKIRTQGVIAAIGDGISIVDRDFRVLYQNAAMRKLIGDHVGEFCYQAYERREDRCEGCPVAEVFTDGEAHTAERVGITDHVEVHVEITATPLMDTEGNIIGGIEAVRDITERKRIQSALRESESRYRTLAENSTAGIWQITPEGSTIYLNPAMCKMLEIESPEEIVGVTYHSFFTSESLDLMKIEHAKRPNGIASRYEVKIAGKRGRELDVVISGAPLIGADGKLHSLIGTFTDITERKRAEEQLFQIKQDWEDAFNIITDMITVHDKDFNIIRANKAAENILGLPFLQTKRSKCYAYYHGTEKPPEGCPSCNCLVTGKAASFEIFEPHLKKFIEIRAIPRFDSNNNLIGLIHVVRDITERKKAEDELRFLALIVQNIPDAVCSIDLDANILSWNEGAENMLGYKTDEIIGKPLDAIIPEALQQTELEHCLDLLNTAGHFAAYESQRLAKDGRIIPVEITGAVLRDENGNAKRYSAIMKDVTERKKTETQLIDYSESLEQKVKERTQDLEDARLIAESANRAKSMFLANMSHELRTPLNAIIGFSEAFTAGVYGELREDHREYMNDIFQSGMQLLSLINSILDLSRIETGSMELEYSECFVKDIINVIYMFKEKAKKHNMDLRVIVDDDIGAFTVDEVKIKQVIINLISNAFKFTPDGGSVIVTARRVKSSEFKVQSYTEKNTEPGTLNVELDADFVEISVSDNGKGISNEDLKRIFNPFVQINDDVMEPSPGAGLGLTLCKRFVEMHGGKIWVESPPGAKPWPDSSENASVEGKGTRFIFVLPRRPSGGKLKKY